MTGYVLPEYEPNRRSQQLGLAGVKPSFGEGFGAAFEEAWVRNPGPSALRSIRRMQYPVPGQDEPEYGPRNPAPRDPEPEEEPDYNILEPGQANEKYGIGDELKFDARIAEPVAEELSRLKREEIQRRDVMRRAESGFGTQLTAGLAASVLDPVNIASAFVPAVSTAKAASLASRYGKTQGRAITGATEGAVGAAAVEPIVYGVAQEEQADYTAVDSLVNLTFGSALGAGLHLGVGAVVDRVAPGTSDFDAPPLGDRQSAKAEGTPLQKTVDSLPRQDQEALLRTAVSQVAEGRPVRIDSVLNAAKIDNFGPRSVDTSPVIRMDRPDPLEGMTVRADREEIPPTPERIEEVAESTDPEAFSRLSQVQQEIGMLNQRLAKMRSEGEENAQIASAANRIDEINRRLEKPNIGDREAAILEAELDKLESRWSDSDFQRALASHAKKNESQKRDVAQVEQQISKLRRHQTTLRRRANAARQSAGETVRPSEQYRFTVEQAKNDARADPAPEYARASATAAEAAEEVKGPPRDLADEEKAITDDIAEREQALSQEERDGIRESVAEDEKTARTYEKAWKVAATCRIRNSGAA